MEAATQPYRRAPASILSSPVDGEVDLHVLRPPHLSAGEMPGWSSYGLKVKVEAASSGGPEQQAEQADPATRLRLVFFHSPTSGRCRRTEAQLAHTLQRRKNRARFEIVRVNVDERPDLAERFRVEVVPTLVVIEGRRVVRRIVSPETALDLARPLSAWLG